jgi:hypothetical protein
MAPWQWRNLPSHARARWTVALHQDLASRNEYGRLEVGPEWVKRPGASHLFGIEAVTRSSFQGMEDGWNGSGDGTNVEGTPAVVATANKKTSYTGQSGGVDQRGPRFVINYIIKT